MSFKFTGLKGVFGGAVQGKSGLHAGSVHDDLGLLAVDE